MLDEIETQENLVEWMAFARLEPFGFEVWSLLFGRVCEQINNAVGVIARISIPIRPWHYFFKPPYGFVGESDDERVVRLLAYTKTAEDLEMEMQSDEQMAEGARARAAAFKAKKKRKEAAEEAKAKAEESNEQR